MKTSQLKKIIEDNGLRLKVRENVYDIYSKDLYLCSVGKEDNYIYIDYPCPKNIAQTIVDYAYTHLEEREEEKKYWVVLPKRDLQRNAIANEKSISILTTEPYKTQYTLKQIRELDFLKEIDGQWYMKLELEEIE